MNHRLAADSHLLLYSIALGSQTLKEADKSGKFQMAADYLKRAISDAAEKIKPSSLYDDARILGLKFAEMLITFDSPDVKPGLDWVLETSAEFEQFLMKLANSD